MVHGCMRWSPSGAAIEMQLPVIPPCMVVYVYSIRCMRRVPRRLGGSMADILALFGVILLVGAALSGLLTAHWLLFPGRVAVAAK